MSDSLRPYGLQPARPLCPWASPGKNIGVGRHFQNEVICVGPSPTGLVPLKEEEFRIWAHMGDDHVKTQGGDSHLQAKEGDFKYQHSDTLMSDL